MLTTLTLLLRPEHEVAKLQGNKIYVDNNPRKAAAKQQMTVYLFRTVPAGGSERRFGSNIVEVEGQNPELNWEEGGTEGGRNDWGRDEQICGLGRMRGGEVEPKEQMKGKRTNVRVKEVTLSTHARKRAHTRALPVPSSRADIWPKVDYG